jgi:hypothetical protein
VGGWMGGSKSFIMDCLELHFTHEIMSFPGSKFENETNNLKSRVVAHVR